MIKIINIIIIIIIIIITINRLKECDVIIISYTRGGDRQSITLLLVTYSGYNR
jgi:hypothetical protein